MVSMAKIKFQCRCSEILCGKSINMLGASQSKLILTCPKCDLNYKINIKITEVN